jgi:hypothetical protein
LQFNLPSPALSGTLSHQWARAFLLSIGFMAGIAEKTPILSALKKEKQLQS